MFKPKKNQRRAEVLKKAYQVVKEKGLLTSDYIRKPYKTATALMGR